MSGSGGWIRGPGRGYSAGRTSRRHFDVWVPRRSPGGNAAHAPLHGRRAAAFWRGRTEAAPDEFEKPHTAAFPLVLSVAAVRDATFFEKLRDPNAGLPRTAADPTPEELETMFLFAKIARLPNLLLWPTARTHGPMLEGPRAPPPDVM